MHNFIFSRGPIKLYPLPGTEEYVAKVAHWLAGNLLKEAEKQKANLLDSLKICDIDSVRRSIFQEIQKLEEEYTNIKTEISIEESQCIKITIPQVKFFLTQIKKGIVPNIV